MGLSDVGASWQGLCQSRVEWYCQARTVTSLALPLVERNAGRYRQGIAAAQIVRRVFGKPAAKQELSAGVF